MATKKRTASYDKLGPDVRFNSVLVSKFINCLMRDGKKATATRVVCDAMDQIKKRMPDVDPLEVYTTAVNNVRNKGASLIEPHESQSEATLLD